MVKPLAEHYIGVRLDYYQQRGARQGALWRELGNGLDTAAQVIFSPGGKIITAHRSYKNGSGIPPAELLDIASRFSSDAANKDLLRLSWFLMDPAAYRGDVLDDGAAARYREDGAAVLEARKVRRPLVRLDGDTVERLEEHQEFLRRHVRQFWWRAGDPAAPARLIVLDAHDCAVGAEPTALTGKGCVKGKVPAVMGLIDISGGIDLEKLSPELDRLWRRYMTARPSNAGNLTFAKDQIPAFKQVDALIRELARSGRLLAPGGRKLLERESPAAGEEQNAEQRSF
jgi:hypothetical protein